MDTFWILHNWWLNQRADFDNAPLDHKEDTILGIACFILGLIALPYLLHLL